MRVLKACTYFVPKVSKNRNDVFIKFFRFLLTFSLMVIFLEMLIVFLILALILATPMGILYKLTYSGHEMYGLRPFCTPYETDYGHHKRKEDGNRSAFSIN